MGGSGTTLWIVSSSHDGSLLLSITTPRTRPIRHSLRYVVLSFSWWAICQIVTCICRYVVALPPHPRANLAEVAALLLIKTLHVLFGERHCRFLAKKQKSLPEITKRTYLLSEVLAHRRYSRSEEGRATSHTISIHDPSKDLQFLTDTWSLSWRALASVRLSPKYPQGTRVSCSDELELRKEACKYHQLAQDRAYNASSIGWRNTYSVLDELQAAHQKSTPLWAEISPGITGLPPPITCTCYRSRVMWRPKGLTPAWIEPVSQPATEWINSTSSCSSLEALGG